MHPRTLRTKLGSRQGDLISLYMIIEFKPGNMALCVLSKRKCFHI